MKIREYLKLKGVRGNIHTKNNKHGCFVCYFDLFHKMKGGNKDDLDLVIVEGENFNSQILSLSNNSYLVISHGNIQTFDILLNALFFPEGFEKPHLPHESIFESLWNYSYKNQNGEKIFDEGIKGSENEHYHFLKCRAAIEHTEIPSSNLLKYLKSLKNYSMGFEIFIAFIIGHEFSHKLFNNGKEIPFDFEHTVSVANSLGGDWVENHVVDFSSLLENESTVNESASDLISLLMIGEKYIKNDIIDVRIIHLYIVVLFNNLFVFYLLEIDNQVDPANLKEILLRKALCINFLRRNYPIKGDELFEKLLCHIDSYLIEVAIVLSGIKLKDGSELNLLITTAVAKMKYINGDYIPEGFDKNNTTDSKLLRKWIDETAKELIENE